MITGPAAKPRFFQGRTGLMAALRSRLKRLMGQLGYDPQVTSLLRQLQTLGFTEAPLADLTHLARTARDPYTRTCAAIELAKWCLRPPARPDPRQALDWIAVARGSVRLRQQRRHLVVLELLALQALGEIARGRRVAAAAAAEPGFWTPDLALASVMFASGPASRIATINDVLAGFGIAPLGLDGGTDRPLYDRLICTAPPPPQTEGPLVSVIMATYEAGETLRTALGALQAQSWRNLEILVVDDASPSGSTARILGPVAQADPRFRLIRMPVNAGAYMARNHALDQARGDYVTLHDSDDWSHPQKIATQVAYLQANPDVLGCTSQQARATEDLDFPRWGNDGHTIIANYSSFMFRRAPMRARFGYWDTLRLSADNELIRRMRAACGQRAVRFLPTGPLSFQRHAAGTVTGDPVLGINGFTYGARQEYLEAQELHHARHGTDATGAGLRYAGRPDARPFPAPGIMQPDRARIAAEENDFDVLLATDFRPGQPGGPAALADALAFRAAGMRVAVFARHRYLGPVRWVIQTDMDPKIRAALQDRQIRILCHGEQVTCRHLLIHDPACVIHPQRYLPQVRAGTILLVADPEDPLRADACARLRTQFGSGPDQGAANQGVAAGQTAAGQTATGDGAAQTPILSCPPGMAARQAVLAARA